ncbi:unnamed protein product [Leptidea sinapis]|uniref:Uncharacterized protein n=1 Tax=Leptidea sinapis TaxID=189913 RepID=A0A5E4QDU6_9NEOP|nr:unnamed protein product [Leptidea sinapis]
MISFSGIVLIGVENKLLYGKAVVDSPSSPYRDARITIQDWIPAVLKNYKQQLAIYSLKTTSMNTFSALPQINKRRFEFGVDVEAFRIIDRQHNLGTSEESMEDEAVVKRRRRLLDDEQQDNTEERCRVYSTSSHHDFSRLNVNENYAHSHTIMKSTSSTWPEHPSPESGDENDDNEFENYFSDKRSDKMLPSSPSQSSESTDDSQKSFSLNNQLNEQERNDNEEENEKENNGAQQKPDTDGYDGGHRDSKNCNHYDATHFDDLVDSSSNELEIDMSDRNDDRYEDEKDIITKQKEIMSVNKQTLYNAYKAATASLPYSTQSAFKPPAEVKHKIHTNSFPSEPFGGYSNDHEKSSKVSKQYTILQPAGLGSRAASALHEARAVPSTQPTRDSRSLNPLSPTAARGTAAVNITKLLNDFALVPNLGGTLFQSHNNSTLSIQQFNARKLGLLYKKYFFCNLI